jgi:hypothetical protein
VRCPFWFLVLTSIACASSPPPPASAPSPDSTGASEPSPGAPSAAPAPAAGGGARPLDLTNNCSKETRFYYGEEPGDGKGEFTTVASGASVPVKRGPDGAVVVWVVGDQGLGLASVHVTRRMTRVRLDAACAHIDAD